jgi:mannose-1-phosphate guanylyltransferase
VKALLIAGGFGTRLRPLTYTRPKHLLPIANRPHLYHVFDLLERYAVDEIVLLTSYMTETFEPAREEAANRGMSVIVKHEDVPLGTAGALKNAEDVVGDDAFFALNGDVLTDMDLDAVLRFHRDREAEATIVLTPVEDPSAFGVVPTDEEGRVQGFIEKPPPGDAPTDLINAGVYLLEPGILERIPTGVESSAERELFPGLVSEGARLYATPTDAYWADIGTPAKYLQANLAALTGRFRTDAVPEAGEGVVVGAAEAKIADDARVSSACFGPGTKVEPKALVERTVTLAGAVIGSEAEVRDSILGEDVKVQPGARIEGETIADGEEVGAS